MKKKGRLGRAWNEVWSHRRGLKSECKWRRQINGTYIGITKKIFRSVRGKVSRYSSRCWQIKCELYNSVVLICQEFSVETGGRRLVCRTQHLDYTLLSYSTTSFPRTMSKSLSEEFDLRGGKVNGLLNSPKTKIIYNVGCKN